jgi:hypothetical protein
VAWAPAAFVLLSSPPFPAGGDRRKSISGHFLFLAFLFFRAFFAPFFFFAILITSFRAS